MDSHSQTGTQQQNTKDSINIPTKDLVSFLQSPEKYRGVDGKYDRNTSFGKKLYEAGAIDENGKLNSSFISG
jgi:hypothetical protein